MVGGSWAQSQSTDATAHVATRTVASKQDAPFLMGSRCLRFRCELLQPESPLLCPRCKTEHGSLERVACTLHKPRRGGMHILFGALFVGFWLGPCSFFYRPHVWYGHEREPCKRFSLRFQREALLSHFGRPCLRGTPALSCGERKQQLQRGRPLAIGNSLDAVVLKPVNTHIPKERVGSQHTASRQIRAAFKVPGRRLQGPGPEAS